jgi:hypothetical protein
MPVGPFRTFTHGVNVSSLAERFEAGAEVTPETLLAARVLRTLRHPVKILGDGEITIALTVHAHRFSASARQKIEAAGGTVVLIDPVEEPEAPVRDEVKRAASEARAAAAAKTPKKKPAADDDEDVAADAADEREESKRAASEARAAAAAKKKPAEDEDAVEADGAAGGEDAVAADGPAEEPVAESDEPAADESTEDDEA